MDTETFIASMTIRASGSPGQSQYSRIYMIIALADKDITGPSIGYTKYSKKIFLYECYTRFGGHLATRAVAYLLPILKAESRGA
jgi:hypothetical protein